MTCNHKFQGDKDGVRCLLCGLRMTPQEYAEYLHPSAPEEPENVPDVPDIPEEPENIPDAPEAPEAPTGEPQAEPVPKKPKTRRRKKEAAADE